MKHQIKESPEARRSVGRKTWNLLAKLPLFIRGPIIRRLFSVDYQLPPNLIFKKAETPKEIEQAFAVAFEGYRQRGLVDESENRLRVTKYHALPTTAILIAKEDDEVIATITVVVDSAMGLPLEKLWNIQDIRASCPRIAEISTLSIRKDHRARRGKLLLPLMDFMHKYCMNVLGVDKILASVHPEVADFYRCVLLFQMINEGEVKTYEFVKGAAAVAGWLSLPDYPVQYKKVYGTKPSNRNLLHFFTQPSPPNYQFENRKYRKISDFSYSPSLLEYFFKHKSEVIKELSAQDRSIIANSYFYPEFTDVIQDGKNNEDRFQRVQARFAVFYNLQLRGKNSGRVLSGNVLDISRLGLRVFVPGAETMFKDEEVILSIELGDNRILPLNATISWIQGDLKQLGLKLNEFTPKVWHDLVGHLESELVAKTIELKPVTEKTKVGL